MGKLKWVGLKIHFPTHFQSKTPNKHNKNLHKSFTSPKITQKIKKKSKENLIYIFRHVYRKKTPPSNYLIKWNSLTIKLTIFVVEFWKNDNLLFLSP
jgi:hypothetical protein